MLWDCTDLNNDVIWWDEQENEAQPLSPILSLSLSLSIVARAG